MGGWGLGGCVGGGMVGGSDTDNKDILSPASLCYAANEAVAELGNRCLTKVKIR